MFKNVAGQKVAVFAYDTDTNAPKTGDAANITAQISKDGGATAATNDVNPTELDATDAKGVYLFDTLQAESNADLVILSPVSSTANITLEPVIIYTQTVMRGTDSAYTGTPPTAAAIVNEWESQSQADPTGFHVNVIEVNGTAQTPNDNGADINAILIDTGTTLSATLTTIDGKLDTVDGIVDAILVDTGTTIQGMLAIIDSEIGTIDGNVDAILVDTGTTLPGLIGTIDANVDLLIVRVPSEVAQKLHLVNGSGDITPPTDKGIWDALGDGTVAISGTIDANIIEIKGVAGDATKLAKMLYAFVNKVIETKTETGSTLAIRNDADDADAYTVTITETTTTRTRTAIS
jgi:hypothetical protein